VRWRAAARALGWAFAFGIVAGLLAGQSGDGRALVSQVRGELGTMSAPWVLLAWWAGSRAARVWSGAVLGLVATLVALVGFYVVSGLVEPMGGPTVLHDVASWMWANRVWFEAGVVSGPVFGALGAWWARRRAPGALVVAGALLAGEPLVLWLTGAVLPNGVMSPLTGLPLVVRVVPGLGLSGVDAVSLAVRGLEVAVGVALIAAAILRRRRSVAVA
jgi:hypothetical protein